MLVAFQFISVCWLLEQLFFVSFCLKVTVVFEMGKITIYRSFVSRWSPLAGRLLRRWSGQTEPKVRTNPKYNQTQNTRGFHPPHLQGVVCKEFNLFYIGSMHVKKVKLCLNHHRGTDSIFNLTKAYCRRQSW